MIRSLRFLTRFRRQTFSLLMLLLIGGRAQAQSNATPAIRYVRTNGTNANPAAATSWATSTTNLQGAIDASSAGDQVWVAAGTYKPGGNANTNREVSFAMKNGVMIYGGFPAIDNPTMTGRNPDSFTTVLSGNLGTVGESYHVILNSEGVAATAVLDGFVITDGNANGSGLVDKAYGGGMLNVNSSPTLNNCHFVSNSASQGGGMSNREGSNPILTNCSFMNNRVNSRGGGMFNEDRSNPTLNNCLFVSNSASVSGGGMYNTQVSSPNLTNCSFRNNSTSSEGGGMDNRSGSPILTNCIFQGNSASQGGGMFNRETGNPALINCSFMNNSRSLGGGEVGYGIYNVGAVRLTNCVLFNNGGSATFGNGVNTINDVRGTITVTYSLLEAGVADYVDGGNNITTAISPFVSPTDASLNACAPAINTGNNEANTTTTDLAGTTRIVNSRIDMGAYEYQAAPTITLTAPSVSTATASIAFSQSFTATGGTSPYSYSVATGSLPPGLSLATTGVVSGTPTQSGSFTLAVLGRDATGCLGVSAAYVLTVSEPPSPIRYVKADATGSGKSWADASGDLQNQINVAGAQQVWVAAGTYKPGGNANTNREVSFAMKNGVAIYGGFAGNEASLSQRVLANPLTTILSGDIGTAGNSADNSFHVISNPPGLTTSAVLDGFLITGGSANGNGGGMYNAGRGSGNVCSPTVRNCSFQNNSASSYGGAVCNDGAGGGISSPVLTNCSFQNNSASSGGGGMFNQAIFNGTTNPVLTNCSFQNNSSSNGGAMFNDGNSAGISSPVLTNCSFQNNSASSGGAMYNNGLFGISSPVLTNCVLFGNGRSNSIIKLSDRASVSATYSLFETGVTNYTDGGNNLTTAVSPFVSDTDARLNACAPAINAGNNEAISATTDLAGNPRRYNGGTIDMGAYEYQGQPNLPTAITQQPPSGSLVCQGSTVSIPLSVGETGPFIYQLVNQNGAVGPAQTNTPLTLANVQPAQTGSYSVVVSGACSSVTTTAFTLTVTPTPIPVVTTQQTPDGFTIQVSGGVNYERVKLIERINGYEIRQTEQNQTGYFVTPQPGPYIITVIGNNGCRVTVSGTL